MSNNLKSKTINSLLWNTVNNVFTQLCYAVTGVVLARLLPVNDFGLIGIIMAFAAFVNIFIDGGFSTALVQKEKVTDKDYSTIFFFNLFISCVLYLILYFTAPLIAHFYKDEQLILLARVMFLNIIFLSFGLVQSSILMRNMNMKKLTIANTASLGISGALALVMAFTGCGVWALVAQTLSLSFCKSAILWIGSQWRPTLTFSKDSFRSIFAVGSNILMTSFINTFFQNIYSLIIGAWYSTRSLAYYTQADKWSKMGTMGLSQIIGFSLLPTLSSIQNDKERMQRVFGKINKTTSYLTFPAFTGLIIVAQPLFHLLFGTKWDASVVMFQLLTIKGIFFIFTSLLNNYIIAIGRTRVIFLIEVVKDITALILILITVQISVMALIIGQVAVGIIHYLITAWATERYTSYSVGRQFKDMLPYLCISLLMGGLLLALNALISNEGLLLMVQIVVGGGCYALINRLMGSKIQEEVIAQITRRPRKKG